MTQEEIVQIVDSNNIPIDAVPRSIMRAQKLIHRACYILVLNRADELFLQKRTLTKDIYPGYWSVAAGGVVQAGESYEDSARRELFEELGITAPLNVLFDHFYDREDNRVWGRIYWCRHEGPFTLQAEEIEYGQSHSLKQILEISKNEPVTPDGIEIIHRLRDEEIDFI
ncbi:NUDIX hydrolase [Desulfosediminicola sp.]|uniref:NUDIX hydrolase n=1 Tax=Desulfosediminicola sp. TaxID=2886825 RepID=UPI003AF22A3C